MATQIDLENTPGHEATLTPKEPPEVQAARLRMAALTLALGAMIGHLVRPGK